jgi:methyl-accepting chemotaxis protein
VDEDRADEIGQLGKYLNLFVEKVGTLLAGIVQISQNVASASTEISSLAGKGAEGTEVEKDQTAQVATAMQEMTSTVAQVSEHSNRAAEAARQASDTAAREDP